MPATLHAHSAFSATQFPTLTPLEAQNMVIGGNTTAPHGSLFNQHGLSAYAAYGKPQPEWTRTLYRNGGQAGTAKARPNRHLPAATDTGLLDPVLLPAARPWELHHLFAPVNKARFEVASTLLDMAEQAFGSQLWSACAAGSPVHLLLLSRGWTQHPLPVGAIIAILLAP